MPTICSRAIWPMLAAMTMLAAIGARADAGKSCALHAATSLDAELTPGNTLLVHASIDDQPAVFITDTGASTTVLFDGPAARLGLTKMVPTVNGYGVDGRSTLGIVMVPSLLLGTMISKGQQFPVVPGNPDPKTQLVGFFGADYLSHYDVELDLAKHKLNLFSQDHCPGNVVYWADAYHAMDIDVERSGHITTAVELDGETIRAAIDTGATGDAPVLRLETAARKLGIAADSPGVTAGPNSRGINAERLATYRYRFKTLKFGDVIIHNPEVSLTSFRDSVVETGHTVPTWNGFDMLIGMSVLKKLHFYIAYGEKRFYYTIDAPTAAPPG